MSLREWRLRRSMRDPVRGEFRLSGEYFAHPGSSSFREMLTGVLSGPGVPATAVEHLDDGSGRRIGHDVLPALIDRSDPTRFLILWEEIAQPDFRAQARQKAAEEAARLQTTGPGEGSAPESFPAGQPYGGDAADDAPVPEWAQAMLHEMGVDGTNVHIIGGGTHVVDLTAGHLTAAGAADLLATGRPASAILVSVNDVPVPQMALPGPTASLCDLVLQVARPDGTTYEAATRLGFRDIQRRHAIAVPGANLPVRVDPADESRVAVDVAAFDARPPRP